MLDDRSILEEKLGVPKDLIPTFRKMVSPEETRILVLITDEFLAASDIAHELDWHQFEITPILQTLYQKGFLQRKIGFNGETYRSRTFYDIVSSNLQEGRFGSLGYENLHALRQYYLSTRIAKTDRDMEKGSLEYSSKVIPIEKSIPVVQYVLPTQQAIKILKDAKVFALAKCGCRVTFRNCDKPLDTCLLLDEEADFLLSRGYARKISIKEAKEVLEIADKAGLVHLTLYLPYRKVYAICSCCPCCCHDLQALLKYGKTFFVAKSNYFAVCDDTRCNGCGVCVKRCIFGARQVRNGKSIVIREHCYGCGLCVTTCPVGASRLMEKSERYPTSC
jgi:NAD-dependent dihydropyrimidine dehydrogenase PreA subunit